MTNKNLATWQGFSFEPQTVQFEFTGLKDFVGALVSTMMDNATNQSLAKLAVGDVHYIKTTTSTLDFRAALDNDLDGDNYGNYVKDVNTFLSDFLARKRMQSATVSAEELARRMMELHEALRKNQSIRIKKVRLAYKSNSLKIRDLDNPASTDEFYLTNEIVVKSPTYTYGFRLIIDDKVFNPNYYLDTTSSICSIFNVLWG